jgi:putative salt-induced outer membrane protein YdiY
MNLPVDSGLHIKGSSTYEGDRIPKRLEARTENMQRQMQAKVSIIVKLSALAGGDFPATTRLQPQLGRTTRVGLVHADADCRKSNQVFRCTPLVPPKEQWQSKAELDARAPTSLRKSTIRTSTRALTSQVALLFRGKRFPVSTKGWAVLVAVFAFGCVAARAEQVSLKNGDHLTGSIVSMDGKKLVIKTTYAGEVSIDWAEVSQFSSDKDSLVVTKADKQLVSGTVSSEGSDILVTTAQGAQRVPRTDVSTMRSPADQAAYEKSLHPGMLEGWTGGGNVGFALARGNSQTTNLALGVNALRKTNTDAWIFNAASVYSTDDKLGITSANTFGGLIRYDHNISKRWFVYGVFSGMYDTLQLLNYRIMPGGGLGYHAINSSVTTLDFLGGLGYTRESYYNGTTNNLLTATLGDEFTHKFSPAVSITQSLYYLPSLNDTSNYRVNFSFGIATKLNGWMTANANFLDQYVSQPVPGNKNNDVLLTTGLGFTFGAKKK